jgi:predicted GH43/DUF377 family glycosyl hydrolase
MQTHASIPVPDLIHDDLLRIYFGTRDGKGRSQIGFVDVDPGDPTRILSVSREPVLPLGRMGTFDDNGIMPSWLVKHQGKRFLYYIGWNPQVTVSYRLSIGLGISDANPNEFRKYSEGPISDRTADEPFFNTAPCVIIEGGVWRMWYISCTGWEIVDNWPEPRYHVKYAHSSDGINWQKTGIICVDYDEDAAAIGRPCVIRGAGGYEMYYSYRDTRNYRSSPASGYRIGYAVSADGIVWTKRNSDAGISRSEEGWDSEMIEYCSIFEYRGQEIMLYNGNGFGKTGFGYAVRDIVRPDSP